MNESNSKRAEIQAADPLEVRIRILRMQQGDFPSLSGRYLARTLRRSDTAVSMALRGERPTLLARIIRHLDWLEASRAKKLAALHTEHQAA